jgi:hypothetical protein
MYWCLLATTKIDKYSVLSKTSQHFNVFTHFSGQYILPIVNFAFVEHHRRELGYVWVHAVLYAEGVLWIAAVDESFE